MKARGTAGAIIVAAGRSERMRGADKLLEPLRGRPVIDYSIAVIGGHPRIETLVLVTSEANRAAVEALMPANKEVRLALGGPRRRDSVRNGLSVLGDVDFVLVHDGARPLITPEMVDSVLDAAEEAGAALCAVPVTDTIKRADASGLVIGTVSRDHLWLAQTPQAFRTELLRRAHASHDIDVTDDAALVELIDEPVRLVAGSPANIKITRPEDLALAEALLAARRA